MARPPNPVGKAVVAVACVFVAIDLVFILARLWARRLKRVSFDISDYLIIVAWLIALADTIRKIVAANWGIGMHFEALVAANGTAIIVPVNKITFAGFFLWLAIVTFTKLSILFLYRALFRCVSRFVMLVHIMMGVVVVYFIAFSIGTLFSCNPIAFYWDRSIPGGKCMNPKLGFLVSGSLNLVIDVVLVVMPVPIVWKMQHVTRAKKMGIVAMFSLGLLICFLAGFRFKYVLETNEMDFTHDGEIAGIPGELELFLGIMGACLPLISPPLLVIRNKVSTGYLSLVGRKRSSDSESNTSTQVYRKADSEAAASGEAPWENVALKTWPDSTKGEHSVHESAVEVRS